MPVGRVYLQTNFGTNLELIGSSLRLFPSSWKTYPEAMMSSHTLTNWIVPCHSTQWVWLWVFVSLTKLGKYGGSLSYATIKKMLAFRWSGRSWWPQWRLV
jgi:hypothetical protein